VTINSFVTPATTAASVQRGINPATTGFTVNVNSGTYTGAINVNKGVKLLGLNSAISPNTGIRNPEAKLTTASGIMMNVTTTEPVDIKGFEVANAGGAFRLLHHRRSGCKCKIGEELLQQLHRTLLPEL
jgi:hypothetical protein